MGEALADWRFVLEVVGVCETLMQYIHTTGLQPTGGRLDMMIGIPHQS